MRKFIKIIINRPKSFIALIFFITGVFIFGMKNLRMEPSSEALMPKNVDEYRYNMRMKKIFGDSKLYLLTLIESKNGELFSKDNFIFLNKMIEEINEFYEFNYDEENNRLDTVLELGSVTFIENNSIEEKQSEIISDEEIDDILTGETEISSEYYDVFAIDEPLPDDIYTKALRDKRDYSFDKYTPVSLDKLKKSLDKPGNKQLLTILNRLDMKNFKDSHLFTKEQYQLLVDEFETAYLLKSMEAIKSFMNPVSGEDIVGTKDSLIPVDLIEEDEFGNRLIPQNAEDFSAYKKKLLANPVFENNLYSLDGKGDFASLAMNIQLKVLEDPDYMSRYVLSIIDKNQGGDLLFTPVGVPVFEKYIQDYMKNDLKRFMPLVLLVVVITFLLNFKMLRGVLLPTASVIISIIWTMGLMGYMNIPVTMVVNILPTILIAVGSSYSIHIFNQYINNMKEIENDKSNKSLIRSMTHISTTVLLAALTTFIGFSTLGFNQVVSLKHFGIFSAIGTLFTMLIASILIPAFLSLNIPFRKKTAATEIKKEGILQKLLFKMGTFTLNNSPAVIIATLLVIAVSLVGLFKLDIESSPISNFKDDSYVVTADTKVSQALKGSIAINLLIDTGKDNGVKDPEFLKKLDEFAKRSIEGENLEKYNLLSSFTFSDVVKRMNMAMNEELPEFYTIPETQETVEDYIMLFSGEDRDSNGLVDSMERFTDPHYRVANIFIKTGSYNNKLYRTSRLLAAVEALKADLKSDPYFSKFNYTVSGQTINYAVLNNLIAKGQILTIILTLLIIAVIIYIMFRDFKAAIVSLIPISTSIIVVFGIMGNFNIPLDIAKSIIAAITIGIGIDDTIHMLKTIRTNLTLGMDLKQAILKSYHEAGLAIIYTSMALILGFSVLMFSEFKVIFYFGWLVALNMVTTTIAALVILPAAVWLLKIRFNIDPVEKTQKTALTKSNISFQGE